MNTNTNPLATLPTVTKTLLFINIGMFAIAAMVPKLNQLLALHYFESPLFMPHQLVSHLFMHGGLAHLAFNMYALVMFGSIIENKLGRKRFLILYFFAAIGAFLLHMGIISYELSSISADVLAMVKTEGADAVANGQNYTDPYLGGINAKFNGAMVGASGAIMGLFAAFAYIYPNLQLQIIFIPYPIKAKYFMPIYMGIELFLGVSKFEWDNIAHFAHIGGAIFGLLLVFIWYKNQAVPNPIEERFEVK